MFDPHKASEVATKAATGDDISLLQIVIYICLVLAALLCIALVIIIKSEVKNFKKELTDQIGEHKQTLGNHRHAVKEEFEKVRIECDTKQKALTVVEEKTKSLDERVSKTERSLEDHQQSTKFELEQLKEEVDALGHLIKETLLPKITKMAEDFAFLRGRLEEKDAQQKIS